MKILKKIIKIVCCIIGVVVLLGVVGILTLTIMEYKPDDEEKVTVTGEASEQVKIDEDITVMTWNIGYGSLGEYADFFMDGGKMVNTSTDTQVRENVDAFLSEIKSINPDVVFLQEVDENSKRSHYINEVEELSKDLPQYCSSFAYNFKVAYVPYPWPPIGKVSSGLVTLSKFAVTDSTRVSLPCPFSWPMKVANLKRCLMINRVPVEGSDKELVMINLHLEAYDDGEGKEAQTKMLREFIDGEVAKGNYIIAGGDFNQVFSDVDVSAYPVYEGMWQPGKIDVSEFPNATFYTDSTVATCRSLDRVLKGNENNDFQYYVIDGFIVSKNVQVNSVETQDLKFVNTDHNPVVIKVKLQ